MSRAITGATAVAGVAGHPVKHSLSPILHNAWLEAAEIDGVYVAFAPGAEGFRRLVEGFRGGAIRGLNVTLPFKEEALAVADTRHERARLAGAANLLVFSENGRIYADNTDGLGMLGAFANQAPQFRPAGAVVTILGAGGAARGAAAAFLLAGAGEIRLVNRTAAKAEAIAADLGRPVRAIAWQDMSSALVGADALINATSLGLDGGAPLAIALDALSPSAPVMDMVYRPLETPLLAQARARRHPVVDGLEMLVGQAIPSFEAFYGRAPPALNVRRLAIEALGL